MKRPFEAFSYIGPFQNDDGMWTAEALGKLGVHVDIDTEADSVKDICTVLKKEKIIPSADMRRVNATIGTDIIEVHEKKGMKPLCRLVIKRI